MQEIQQNFLSDNKFDIISPAPVEGESGQTLASPASEKTPVIHKPQSISKPSTSKRAISARGGLDSVSDASTDTGGSNNDVDPVSDSCSTSSSSEGISPKRLCANWTSDVVCCLSRAFPK